MTSITKCLLFLSLCTSAVNGSLSFIPRRCTTTNYPQSSRCFNLYTIRGGDEDTDGDKQESIKINDDDIWEEEIRRTREFYRSLGKSQSNISNEQDNNISNDEKIEVVMEDERSFGSNAYNSIQSEIGEDLELSVMQQEDEDVETATTDTQDESIVYEQFGGEINSISDIDKDNQENVDEMTQDINKEDQDVVLQAEGVTYDLVVGGDTSSDESTQEEDFDIEIEELIEAGLVRLHNNKDGINPRLAITAEVMQRVMIEDLGYDEMETELMKPSVAEVIVSEHLKRPKELKSLPSQFYRDVIQNTEHQSRLGSIRRIASNVASRHTTRRILGFVVGCALSFVLSPSNYNSRGMSSPTVATITPSTEEQEEYLIDDESEEYTPLQPDDLDKNLLDKLISLISLLVNNRSHI